MIRATAIVFGCTHDIQRICPMFVPQADIPRHSDQQRSFAKVLAQLVIEQNVSFIGEEISYREASIVQAVANALGLEYSRIDMPLVERIRRGCPGGYEVLFPAEGQEAEVDICHRIREEYMAGRAAEFLADDQTGLIVC